MYLVHKGATQIERGKLYAFKSKDLSPIYAENTQMLKYLMAIPGDQVEITPDERVLVNGEEVAFGLKHAEEKLGQSVSVFVGKAVLGRDEFWFLGTSADSFDSRYWGSVTKDKIVGRAYGLF
jgi:conjugal transfer pilin signal peptidase TrbI